MVNRKYLLEYENTEECFEVYQATLAEFFDVYTKEQTIQDVFSYRKNYHKSLIPNGSGEIYTFNNEMLNQEIILSYKRNIITKILLRSNFEKIAVNGFNLGSIFSSNFPYETVEKMSILLFSDEEILSGFSNKEFQINKKRIGAGAKITKIINALEEGKHSEKSVNVYSNLDVEFQEDFIFSISPVAPLYAGLISSSCLSVGGCNSHTTPNLNSLQDIITVFSSDLDWRCFIYVNYESKIVYIGSGYPYKKPEYSLFLSSFFKKRGFRIATNLEYQELYLSHDTFFTAYKEEMEDIKFCPTFIMNNDDGSHIETASGEYSMEGEIYPYFYNDWEDVYYLDSSLVEERVWSEYHNDYIDPNSAIYVDEQESFIDYDWLWGILTDIAETLYDESTSNYMETYDPEVDGDEEDYFKLHFKFSDLRDHLHSRICELEQHSLYSIVTSFKDTLYLSESEIQYALNLI